MRFRSTASAVRCDNDTFRLSVGDLSDCDGCRDSRLGWTDIDLFILVCQTAINDNELMTGISNSSDEVMTAVVVQVRGNQRVIVWVATERRE